MYGVGNDVMNDVAHQRVQPKDTEEAELFAIQISPPDERGEDQQREAGRKPEVRVRAGPLAHRPDVYRPRRWPERRLNQEARNSTLLHRIENSIQTREKV